MDILYKEAKGCFDFFWNEISTSELTYGLIRDNSQDSEDMHNVCSIASVGFGLAALCVGVHLGFISYEQGKQRCLKTLQTVENLPHLHGFFYHFMDMRSGEGKWNQEFSIIDSSIFLMGALCASEFFKGETALKFEKIYQRVDWNFYLDHNHEAFYMGYHKNGGFGLWNMYAEQMMVYFLAAASPTYPTRKDLFYKMNKKKGRYKTAEFIYTPVGALFPYQFSHAFIDFRNRIDRDGIDWFENSISATLANRQYCIDHNHILGIGEHGWGLTACQGPEGYKGDYGTAPSDGFHICDGTIPPCGVIGSLVFTPEYAYETIEFYYHHYPQLWGKYGFHDAFNLEKSWFCDFEIGIDKGISLLMIANYLDGFIWDLTNQNIYIKEAFQLLGFCNKE